MLKIHQFFFVNLMGLLVSTFILASFVSYFSIKNSVISTYKERLKEGISILEFDLLRYRDTKNISAMIQNIHNSTGMRVTLVDEKGIIMYETNTNKSSMENHATRPEIIEAKKEEYGSSIRHSHTLNTDLLYMAKYVVLNHESVYIRLSIPLHQIKKEFYYLWKIMLWAYLFFIIISLGISYSISQKIKYEVNQIRDYLHEISNNNYKSVIKTKYFSEFLHISLLLKNLVKKLHNRDRQKRKHTARLKLINKQRNDILSAISHEFKNPVASINGYAETLRDDPDINDNLRIRFLEKIISNGNKITHMIDKLSLSVKLENNDLSPDKTKFDLSKLSREVIANLHKKYKDREITFEGDKYIVFADKTMIEMVVINLCDNALKYSQDKVTICIKKDVLTVRDFGQGIAKKDIEKITSNSTAWIKTLGTTLWVSDWLLLVIF